MEARFVVDGLHDQEKRQRRRRREAVESLVAMGFSYQQAFDLVDLK